jgi:hypothetical protein
MFLGFAWEMISRLPVPVIGVLELSAIVPLIFRQDLYVQCKSGRWIRWIALRNWYQVSCMFMKEVLAPARWMFKRIGHVSYM